MVRMRMLRGLTKRRRIFAGATLLFAISLLVVAFTVNRTRPMSGIVVRERPLEHWVEELLRSNDYHCAEAIKEAGSKALPLLREPLARPDTVANSLWVKTWPKLPAAIQARFAQPVLARNARMNTVALLRDMPRDAKAILPDLMARLQDEDGQIRLHTAITMGKIGPEASAATPTLLEFTRSTSHVMRVYSARALWKVSGEVEPALSVLEQGLQEKSAKFRWAAPVFLGEMGTNAVRAIPLLAEASTDPDKEVASLAVQALAQISAETVPILMKQLESDDPGMRVSAVVALGGLGQKAASAIPALTGLLQDTAAGEPTIMERGMGKEKVCDAARAALDCIQNH